MVTKAISKFIPMNSHRSGGEVERGLIISILKQTGRWSNESSLITVEEIGYRRFSARARSIIELWLLGAVLIFVGVEGACKLNFKFVQS